MTPPCLPPPPPIPATPGPRRMATVRDAAELARDVPRTVPKIAKRGGRRRRAQRRRRPRTSWCTKEEETTSGRSSEGATLFRAPNAGDAAARSGPVRPARRGRQKAAADNDPRRAHGGQRPRPAGRRGGRARAVPRYGRTTGLVVRNQCGRSTRGQV